MYHLHSTIFLGDLVRTIEKLQPTNAPTQEAIIHLLGIQMVKELFSKGEASSPAPSFPSQISPLHSSTSTSQHETPPLPAVSSVPSILEKDTAIDFRVPMGISPLPEQTPGNIVDPLPDPLFRRDWQRGILGTALAVNSDDGPLDIDQLVQNLARIEQLERIPYQRKPTLRHGIQLLVDYSEALTPFRADQSELLNAIIRLVGPDRTQILGFEETPLRGVGIGMKVDWGDYKPPPRGTPVVLLTDLGIAQPPFSAKRADSTEWFAFAHILYRAGCSITAFVPYAAKRWPSGMTRAMKIIPWDRRTTVTTIRYLLGRDRD